jgi:hypothetical protein
VSWRRVGHPLGASPSTFVTSPAVPSSGCFDPTLPGVAGLARHLPTESPLDALEERSQDTRVVRMRPALIFKREAAGRIHSLFLGPLVPKWSVRQLLGGMRDRHGGLPSERTGDRTDTIAA